MTSRRFLALDGLRGVCALSVLFYHCCDFFHKGPLFLHGCLAVDVFFILSGFVISLTYEERLKNDGTTSSFLFSRARRLFPTYWLGAAFNIAVFVAVATAGYIASRDSWWMIWLFIPLTTLLIVPDYITSDGVLFPGMDGVAWSLFTEWIAYIVYACGAFRMRTSFVALFALAGWGFMAAYGIWSGKGWSGGGDRATLFTFGLLRCLPAFAAGVVIYRVHRHWLFQRLPVISTEILLLFWLCLACFGKDQIRPVFDAGIITILSPLLICLLIRSDDRAPGYCKVLGEISYPLYVVHPGLIVLATYTPVFGLWHGPKPLNGLLVVVLSLALAWLVALIAANLRNRTVSGACSDFTERAVTERALLTS